MKRIVLTMVLVFVMGLNTIAFASSDSIKVNTVDSSVDVNYTTTDFSNLKVLVKKDGKQYAYDLFSDDETFPLQMGNGSYTVSICEKISGNQYKVVETTTFDLQSNDLAVYLSSSQNVNWDNNSSTSKLAQKLTSKSKSDFEKVSAIRAYVMASVTYDYDKAATVGTRYVPSPEDTLSSKKGICYDYASLTAVMLRSVGVPTKLVKGYSNYTGSTYHAWNEVYVNGQWMVLDTTIDSVMMEQGNELEMAKVANDYQADKAY